MTVNYALILFCLLVATGSIWLTDLAVFRRVRMAGAKAALADFDRRFGAAAPGADRRRAELRERLVRPPAWVEWPAGFFPVLLVIFVVRSFVFEPFRIPSGSMMPTLEVGDFILVNKFAYGLRLPLVDRLILPLGTPQRGDVAVFRYPPDPSENYVKRVIGLPGDTVVYRDERLSINGRPVPIVSADRRRDATITRETETLPRADGTLVHDVLIDHERGSLARPMTHFPFFDQCRYAQSDASVTCTVPAGHYFVMGDNRDNSADSRYWGFVPDGNLVGRAMFVWMNLTKPARIGGFH